MVRFTQRRIVQIVSGLLMLGLICCFACGCDMTKVAGGGLHVYVTLDGAPYGDAPFGEETVIIVDQGEGRVNVVRIGPDSVRMESATCANQDCVHQGEITRENLANRAMGGFIICLPNRVSVEVRCEE